MTNPFATRPLTAATWPDLVRLFEMPGGSIVRGCWCVHYRNTGARIAGAAGQKQQMCDLVVSGVRPGLVGYVDDAPVGWISLGPRAEFLRLRRSPIMKPVDDTDVWSVVCTYVVKPCRGQGIQHRLLAAGIEFAREQGAAVLEAYPVDKAERSHDDFMFFGSRSLYEEAGFTEVVRRSPTRIVMRLTL